MNMRVYVYKGLLLGPCLLELGLVCLNILAIFLCHLYACSMLFCITQLLAQHYMMFMSLLSVDFDMGFLDVSSLNLD